MHRPYNTPRTRRAFLPVTTTGPIRPETVPRQITQAELRQVIKLREAASGKDRLRKSILQRLDDGATIEPGELTVSFSMSQPASVSWRALADVLGYAEVERIKGIINPKPSRRMNIKNR